MSLQYPSQVPGPSSGHVEPAGSLDPSGAWERHLERDALSPWAGGGEGPAPASLGVQCGSAHTHPCGALGK